MSLHCFSHLFFSFLAYVISSIYQELCGLIGSSLFGTGACWFKILLSDKKIALPDLHAQRLINYSLNVRCFMKKTLFFILFFSRHFTSDQCFFDFQSAIYTEQRSDQKHILPWQQMMLSRSSLDYAISHNPTWIHWRVWAHVLVELNPSVLGLVAIFA